MGCGLPGSSVHGILQARMLEWAAIPFSRGSSWPRDRTRVSCVSCIAGWLFTGWVTDQPLRHSLLEPKGTSESTDLGSTHPQPTSSLLPLCFRLKNDSVHSIVLQETENHLSLPFPLSLISNHHVKFLCFFIVFPIFCFEKCQNIARVKRRVKRSPIDWITSRFTIADISCWICFLSLILFP